eukprot:6638211-Prymnesium_polylepis.1
MVEGDARHGGARRRVVAMQPVAALAVEDAAERTARVPRHRAEREGGRDDAPEADGAADVAVQRGHWDQRAVPAEARRDEARGRERGSVAVAGGVGPAAGVQVKLCGPIPRVRLIRSVGQDGGGTASNGGAGGGRQRRWRHSWLR